jgi:hypothetical protein
MTAPEGTSITLTAAPADGLELGGWGGMCQSIGGCTVTLTADADVSASFVQVPLPAICTGLAPGVLPAATQTTISVLDSCTPGLSTETGELALIGFGNGSRTTAIIDVAQRAQVMMHTDPMQSSSSADFVAQRASFMEIVRTPLPSDGTASGSPSQNLVVAAFDANTFSPSTTFVGRLVMAAIPVGGSVGASAGGAILAGDILSITAGGVSVARHQICMLEVTGNIAWCSDREAAGPVYGAAVDQFGRTLVITGGDAPGSITAQWFDGSGKALTGEFLVIENFTAGSDTWFEGRALIGGGLVVRRVDQLNDPAGHPYRTAQWLFAIDAGSSGMRAPPSWLQSNTDIAIARRGMGYAVLAMGKPSAPCNQTIQMLAPDGTRCGSFTLPLAAGSCRTEDVALGRDGTLVEIVPRELRPANSCSWAFWPSALQ